MWKIQRTNGETFSISGKKIQNGKKLPNLKMGNKNKNSEIGKKITKLKKWVKK